MAGRKYVGFNVDISGPQAVNAFLQQISVSMNTPAHIGPVLNWAHSELSTAFDAHMQLVAPTRQSEFHHVYEWNSIGDPEKQLWKNVLRGHGNNRTATFEWRASKSIVPVRADAVQETKSGSGTPPKQIHVFVWKAPVMEYETNLTIAPKRGKFIVYYTGPWNTNGEYYQNVHFSTQPITVRDPGGKKVKGAFTKEYVIWWSKGGAGKTFKSRLNAMMQKNMHMMVSEGLTAIGSRSRNRTFSMQTMGNQRAATSAGKKAARVAMAKMEKNYIEQAKQREVFMDGGL